MDESRIRNKMHMFADTNESGYVWKGPKNIQGVPKKVEPLRNSLCTLYKFFVLLNRIYY